MTTTIQETLLPMKKDIQTVGSANLEIFSDVKMKIVNLNALMDFSIQEKAPMKYMMDTLVRNSTTSWQIFFFPQKTMTNLEKTSAEIRRLVPRLMELSFGCRIKTKTGIYLAEEWNTADGAYIVYKLGGDKAKPNYAKLPGNTKYRIIGHPITLEDALEAFFTTKKANTEYINELILIWQYGKPYDQQSPEIHDFVASILFS